MPSFALGELTGEDAAEVAEAIERDPELQAEVDAIRALTGDLESALAAESLPETEPVHLAEHIEFPMNKRAPRQFPYFWVSGLAAAGFAVLVMVQSPESPLVGTAEIAEPPAGDAATVSYVDTLASSSIIQPDITSGEDYARIEEEGWKRVSDEPLSTFAVDVDSASYANVRRFIQGGQLPPLNAVKVEGLINAFTCNYPAPDFAADSPLQANLEVAAAPWESQHRLVRVGLKAKEMPRSTRAAANLVFLLDVSGSMNSVQKLPLVKAAMRLLLGHLRSDDRVAIVTYAGSSGLALPSTPVSQRNRVEAALNDLRSGGSTNGAMGIHLAYDIAKANFVQGGVNRVILCTDGDFNVGTTGLDELGNLISEKAQADVFLTALGFGMGNYQDDTLERLANRGNGHHGYIDTVREARRLLVEQVDGTLNTVACDVKVQVEFNPTQVAAYRLIGYDNRRLAAQDFNDDSVDAGEVGAGHTVTALYEVIPAGLELAAAGVDVDPLRYQSPIQPELPAPVTAEHIRELLNVKVRAQAPEGGESRKWEFPLVDSGRDFQHATSDFKFAAAVAGFGLVLRDHPSVESTSLTQVEEWARSGLVTDPGGYRLEFIELVGRADQIQSD